VTSLCVVTRADVFICMLRDEAGVRRVSGWFIFSRDDLRLYRVVVQVGLKCAWSIFKVYPDAPGRTGP
jgi:hypothetical protein